MTQAFAEAGKLVPAQLQTGSQLRALGGAELARLGDASLREHLVHTAQLAHCKYAPISEERLRDLLEDRNLVRRPVRIEFAIGPMAAHQFGQPEPDGDAVVLYLHPGLQGQFSKVLAAVAYFLPVVNYGSLINDDHCLLYGATLTGQTVGQYYQELCEMADAIGAPGRDRMAGDCSF